MMLQCIFTIYLSSIYLLATVETDEDRQKYVLVAAETDEEGDRMEGEAKTCSDWLTGRLTAIWSRGLRHIRSKAAGCVFSRSSSLPTSQLASSPFFYLFTMKSAFASLVSVALLVAGVSAQSFQINTPYVSPLLDLQLILILSLAPTLFSVSLLSSPGLEETVSLLI